MQRAFGPQYQLSLAEGYFDDALDIAEDIALNEQKGILSTIKKAVSKGKGSYQGVSNPKSQRWLDAEAKLKKSDTGDIGPTIDKNTGAEVGRFIADDKGNIMIEPVGGSTVLAGRGGMDTHTLYPNGSNYQRYNPNGHPPKSTTPHAHGHLQGTGPGMKGQGPSVDVNGNVVPWNSGAAHWPLN